MRVGTLIIYTSLIFVFMAGGAGCATLTDKAMALHSVTPCGQMMGMMMGQGHGGDSSHGGTALEGETADEALAEQQEGEVTDGASSTQQGAHTHHTSPAEE